MLLRAFCLMVFVRSLFGAADASEWERLMDEAHDARRVGHFEATEAAMQSAMRIAAQLPNSALYQGMTAYALATHYQQHGDRDLEINAYLTARYHFRRAEDRKMDRIMTACLASLYLEIGQLSKAESLVRTFLPDEAHPSAEERADPVMLSDLASIRTRQRRFAEAEQLFRQVVDFVDRREDIGSLEVCANALANLSELHYFAGRMSDAAASAREALRIYEGLAENEPAGLIKALANLAVITASASETSEADDLFRRAIALCESRLGPQHPLHGTVLSRYAVYLRRTNRKGEARKVEAKARQIFVMSRDRNRLGGTVEVGELRLKGR
jgi:tetratricopeptide (TPR) repeat protein